MSQNYFSVYFLRARTLLHSSSAAVTVGELAWTRQALLTAGCLRVPPIASPMHLSGTKVPIQGHMLHRAGLSLFELCGLEPMTQAL